MFATIYIEAALWLGTHENTYIQDRRRRERSKKEQHFTLHQEIAEKHGVAAETSKMWVGSDQRTAHTNMRRQGRSKSQITTLCFLRHVFQMRAVPGDLTLRNHFLWKIDLFQGSAHNATEQKLNETDSETILQDEFFTNLVTKTDTGERQHSRNHLVHSTNETQTNCYGLAHNMFLLKTVLGSEKGERPPI